MEMQTTAAPKTSAEHLGGLITTLELQKVQKRDFIVPASQLRYTPEGRMIIEAKQGSTDQRGNWLNDICHSQVADKLGIPVAYYKKMMASHPDLLAQNVNGWLQKSTSKYLMRTFEIDPEQPGTARAFLSDRYQILDNYDVLLAALEAIKKMGVQVQITKAQVSESRMYLHITCPELEVNAEAFLKGYMKEEGAAAGNGIITGFVLTNSEVGLGTFEIRPRATILKCTNGLIGTDDRFRRVHLGGKLEEGEVEWSERTKQKNYELIISQTQDAVKTFLSKDYLNGMIRKLAEAHQIKLENPMDTVHNVCRELSITEEHKKDILSFFLSDGDHRASGVFNAITRQAQNMNCDAQFEVECGIGKLLPNIQKFDKPFGKN